ncbi:MAG: YciI family protein [Rhodanobacteraceae bacterium]
MRVMVIVKASTESEAGRLPDAEGLAEMGKFNEQLVNAGVMLMADGLHASSKGVRVRFDGKKRTVIDGPFAETKELVAGFWLWQVRSLDEAIEWIKRAPFDGGAVIELRPVIELEDFGDAVTSETIREYRANVLQKAAMLRNKAAKH